jgi:superfamily II DNA/RNA helicase
MEHEKRKQNFHKFDKACEEGKGTLLICTDVASRGLDFKNVAWIV